MLNSLRYADFYLSSSYFIKIQLNYRSDARINFLKLVKKGEP
jgi:hypothetical protein